MATTSEMITDVRRYVNDPTSSPNNIFSETDILSSLNRAYRQTVNLIRRHAPGWFQDVVYTASKTTEEYTLPSDTVRVVQIRVNGEGEDLSASDNRDAGEVIDRVPPAVLDSIRQSNDKQVWAPKHNGFFIVPAFDSGSTGSKSVEIWREYLPDALDTSSNDPDFPAAHHDILVNLAVSDLRASRNWDTRRWDRLAEQQKVDLLIDFKAMDMGEGDQFRTAADADPTRVGNHGFMDPK